jgi:hypothetical protein
VLLDRYRNGPGTSNAADVGNPTDLTRGMLAKMKGGWEKRQTETEIMADKRMEANRESDQEELKRMMNVTQERMDANTTEMNAKWTPTRRRWTANKRKCWPECEKTLNLDKQK